MSEPLTDLRRREIAFAERAGKIFAKARKEMLDKGYTVVFARDGQLISKSLASGEKVIGATYKPTPVKRLHYRLPSIEEWRELGSEG